MANNKIRIILFGGTSEGRSIAIRLANTQKADVIVCVATEYGEEMLPDNGNIFVKKGRMDGAEIEEFLRNEKPALCIDATHPYATIVSENVSVACENSGTRYIRVGRLDADYVRDGVITVKSADEAAEYLACQEGNILVTTGSKELSAFDSIEDHESRCYIRVLPSNEAMDICREHGYSGRNIIAMQGPFSEKLNEAIINEYNIKWLVTKSSGAAGGFEEKITAASNCKAGVIVIERPEEGNQAAVTVDELFEILKNDFEINEMKEEKKIRKISLVAMGPGGADLITEGAKKAIRNAQLVIGSKRILELAEPFISPNASKSEMILADEIAGSLAKNDDFETAAVLYTGDLGFSSGAKGMKKRLEDAGCLVDIISGVSSVTYMLNTLGIPWEDTYMISSHGREISNARIVKAIAEHEYLALLPGNKDTFYDLLNEISANVHSELKVYIGSHLSMEDERIFELDITSDNMRNIISSLDYLVVVVFVNTTFSVNANCPYITDEMFLRGVGSSEDGKTHVIPMTKEEIRSLVISKLEPKISDVIWDIGAGTGSVSIQLAQGLTKGHVLAFEKNDAAINLMEQNIKRFKADNISIVNGRAPEAMSDELFTNYTPDKIFIGGAGGKLIDIIKRVREGVKFCGRNPEAVKFAVTAVTIETLAEIAEIKKQSSLYERNMRVISVAVSRSRKLGDYNLMNAENCVYIITFGGIDGNE